MPNQLKRPIPELRLNRKEVDIALAKRGWKMRDLAKAIGRGLPTTSQAINHGEGEPTVRAIAETLGLKLRKSRS